MGTHLHIKQERMLAALGRTARLSAGAVSRLRPRWHFRTSVVYQTPVIAARFHE